MVRMESRRTTHRIAHDAPHARIRIVRLATPSRIAQSREATECTAPRAMRPRVTHVPYHSVVIPASPILRVVYAGASRQSSVHMPRVRMQRGGTIACGPRLVPHMPLRHYIHE